MLQNTTDQLSYIINHLAEENEFYFGAVAPPIVQSSNFSFASVKQLRAAFKNEKSAHLYTRGNNPTVEILRKKLAAMAFADDALVLGSGAAAMTVAVLSIVKAGDHIICMDNPYSWTEKLCRVILKKFGVETTFVSAEDFYRISDFAKPNTSLIIFESPNTFTFDIIDIQKLIEFSQTRNITTLIDNTYCTPLGQSCITMGVDIEIHSASKYLNGHSDVIAGVIIANQQWIDKMYHSEFLNVGAIISPNDAWLILRGLRTLPLRLERIQKATEEIVQFLETHPKVEKIFYPFLSSNEDLQIARNQMKWCGGLFSVVIKSNSVKEVEHFCDTLKSFRMAVSWGGYESLLMPACSFYDADFVGQRKYPFNLIRFSIGLEDASFLIADLKQSFDLMK